jgi:hypothetical protein
VALAEAIPFNRVWSFPKNIVIPDKPFWRAMPMRVIGADEVLPELAIDPIVDQCARELIHRYVLTMNQILAYEARYYRIHA